MMGGQCSPLDHKRFACRACWIKQPQATVARLGACPEVAGQHELVFGEMLCDRFENGIRTCMPDENHTPLETTN